MAGGRLRLHRHRGRRRDDWRQRNDGGWDWPLTDRDGALDTATQFVVGTPSQRSCKPSDAQRCGWDAGGSRRSWSPSRSLNGRGVPLTWDDAHQKDTELAVAVGFEPTEELPPHTLSRRAPLAARTLHRRRAYRSTRFEVNQSRRISPHSGASTPETTSGRWLSRRSRTTSHSEPTAPALGSAAP